MQKIIIGFLIMGLFSFFSKPLHAQDNATLPDDVYQFSFENLDKSGVLNLADFKGKAILIVNTASQCGFTPQYKSLQSLYSHYKDKGLVVIGVPSNDFGGQEPGNGHDIAKFCELNYGVTFPLTAKQIVSGDDAHPFYIWAKKKLGFGTAPKWNFHKYLIDRRGKLVDYYNSTTDPQSDKLIANIEILLNEPKN